MKESAMPRFSRREFLKLAATATISGNIGSLKYSEAAVTEVDFGLEKKVPLLCRQCAQTCPMFGVVRDGRLVRLEPNRNQPYPGLCARAHAAVGALYSPDRVKTPLIRAGERGEGKFRRATWDEALDVLVRKLTELRESGDSKAVSYHPRFTGAPGMDGLFFGLYGTPNIVGYGDACYGNSLSLGLAAITGGKLVHGMPSQGTSAVSSDYENAEYGLLISRNVGGGLVAFPWAVAFGTGKRKGLKITVVDPRNPPEAGESDAEWLPIRPGTDSAFMLGLLNVIVESRYYDEDYLQKYTNADMLVDVETLLPASSVKRGEGKEEVLDYLVYDQERKDFSFKSEVIASTIYGSYEVETNGRMTKCKTAFELFTEEVKDFTPQWAQEICDVPADKIAAVAKRLDQYKPKVFVNRGYRSARYNSALREQLLITQLNIVLGALGREGGVFWQRKVELGEAFKKPPKPKDESIVSYYIDNEVGLSMANAKDWRRIYAKSLIEGRPYRSKVAVFNGQNIVGGSSGSTEIAEALKKLELIVVISPYFNETSMYADIVLPDATFMERDEVLRLKFKAPMPTIGVNRKAVEPLFESKDGYSVFLELARKVFSPDEFREYFGDYESGGMRAIWEKQYSGIKKITPEEMATIPSLNLLLDRGIWTGGIEYKVKAKGTPTGKLELYSLYLARRYRELKDAGYEKAEYGCPLPRWNPPRWLTTRDKLGADEFVPITGFSPLYSFTGAQTKDNLLIRVIADMVDLDAVWINREKGERLGIRDGETVEIINSDIPGLAARSRIRLSETVHPDALFAHYGVASGSLDKYSEFLRYSYKGGFNPNHISTLSFIPLTGGQPAQDFVVRIRRA
jgi:anaerobic selenocysteine-containing dehydrogenase